MERLGIQEWISRRGSSLPWRECQEVSETSWYIKLKHLSTWIEVKCSKACSQAMNSFFYRCILALNVEEALMSERFAETKDRSLIM